MVILRLSTFTNDIIRTCVCTYICIYYICVYIYIYSKRGARFVCTLFTTSPFDKFSQGVCIQVLAKVRREHVPLSPPIIEKDGKCSFLSLSFSRFILSHSFELLLLLLSSMTPPFRNTFFSRVPLPSFSRTTSIDPSIDESQFFPPSQQRLVNNDDRATSPRVILSYLILSHLAHPSTRSDSKREKEEEERKEEERKGKERKREKERKKERKKEGGGEKKKN